MLSVDKQPTTKGELMRNAKQLDTAARRDPAVAQFADRFLAEYGDRADFDNPTEYGYTVGQLVYLLHKARHFDKRLDVAADMANRLKYARVRPW